MEGRCEAGGAMRKHLESFTTDNMPSFAEPTLGASGQTTAYICTVCGLTCRHCWRDEGS